MGSRESDRRTTPLHSAALAGHPDVVRMLLRRGGDAAAEDEQGCDPAFLAKRAGHHECQQILLHHLRERFTSLAVQTIAVSFTSVLLFEATVCSGTSDNNGQVGDKHFVHHCSEVVPSLEIEMYGQYNRQGANGVSIVGRLFTLQSVHYQRFHCTPTSLSGQGSLDAAMVRRADVCQVTEDGATLLTLAAKHGHAHLLSQLVKFETCPLDYRHVKVSHECGSIL